MTPGIPLRERYQVGYVVDDQPECLIYRATDQHTYQSVLIAELPQEDAAALASTRLLAQEVATVQIDGLLPILQHFAEGMTYYMVVDDPGVQDMQRAVHDPAMLAMLHDHDPEIGMPRLVERLRSVLAALHNRPQPVLVGDLQASDVWLSAEGQLYLAPFAVLRPIAAGQSPYRAPELDDPAGEPTPASDLYALGAVGYHLLTGWPPTTAALRVAGTPLNAPRSLNGQLPPLLDQVVMRCLELVPGNRYQTMNELRRALELVQLMLDMAPGTGTARLAQRNHQPLATASAEVGVDTAGPPLPVEVAPEPLAESWLAEDEPPAEAEQAGIAPVQSSTCLIVAILLLGLMAMTVCAIGGFILVDWWQTFVWLPFW